MADNLYVGRRAAGILPEADYELQENAFYYTGSIGVSVAPASEISREWVYIGRRGVALNTAAAGQEFSKEYAGSIGHSWLPDLIQLEAAFAYVGSIEAIIKPGVSDHGIERSYVGSIGISLVPQAVAGRDAVYAGQVTVLLAPAAGKGLGEKSYQGSISVQVRPVSAYEGSGVVVREYSGSIPVELMPYVTSAIIEAVYAGSIPLGVVPAAEYESVPIGEHRYTGSIPVGLVPAGASHLESPGVVHPKRYIRRARPFRGIARAK